jgi:hypothetical protein
VAQETLVETDIEAGRQLLNALQESELPVLAMFWLLRDEETSYRLIVASPLVDQKGKRALYLRIAELLSANHLTDHLSLMRVELMRTDEPVVKAIRRFIRIPGGGARLHNNVIDGVWIPDAYVYRAA